MHGNTIATLALLQGAGGGPGFGVLLIQLALFAAIFYFILIRPQRQAAKRHQETLSKLEKGDRVITEGGIIAEVIHIKDNEITIKTAENTRLLIVRGKIARVLKDEAGRPVEA